MRTPYGVFPPDQPPSKEAAALLEQVETDGGQVLAVYREPVGDHWHLFALLPREKVEPTPYQRDLSPTHAKRLTDVVKRLDRFVDPIVAVSPKPGLYWTPNGHHRLAALTKLKADWVPAILIPEYAVAYQILALNTEKAHNLKEKSLEVIRMYRGLASEQPRASEEDFTLQFEAPHFITLGLLYEENTPLTRARKVLPSFDQTFTKLVAAILAFDVAKVRYEDVQRSAVYAAPD